MTVFYGYFRSSAAYRCRIAFNLKGFKPETRFIHLAKGEQRAPDFLAANPHGLLPALEVGGRLLTQSIAIIEWLDETHPDPPLLPRDPLARAHVRGLALSIACDIHPLQNLRVLNHVRDTYGQDRDGMFAWARHFVQTGLEALEKQVATSGLAGRFCFGDAPTLADICLAPQMFSAARFGADTSGLTTLKRIQTACDELPAFHAAHPSRQPDTEA
jgi:maleylpyruvate isomerase